MNHPLIIKEIILHRMNMKLKNPFQTSFGTVETKDFFIVEAVDQEGYHGYGETVAFDSPWYTEETTETNLHIIENSLIPLLLNKPIYHPNEIIELFQPVRKNNMAKASIEGAVWDIYAKRQNLPLYKALGGVRQKIDVGVSIGIQSSISTLLQVIEKQVEEGYKRIKLKIKPGWDIDVLRAVRSQFPDLPIMVDANSAYTLADVDHLKQLDVFQLMMIEQPLAQDDLLDHAKLQSQLETPICLDESIHTIQDVRLAIELGSCKVINIKIGRVGGITIAKQIHDMCAAHNITVWCGGMLEAGVGRAHSLAISTLPQFTIPGDTSASSRYWEKDIIEPAVTMDKGEIQLPELPGISYEIDWGAIEKFRVDKRLLT